MTRPDLDDMLTAAETGWPATIRLIGRILWADRWVYLAVFATTVSFALITRANA